MKKFWMIILVSRFETPSVNGWLRWTVLASDIWIFWEWTENGQTRSPRPELLDVTGEQIRHLITFSIFFLVIFVTFHGTVIPSKVNNTEDVTNRFFKHAFYNARINSFFSKTLEEHLNFAILYFTCRISFGKKSKQIMKIIWNQSDNWTVPSFINIVN